MNLSGGQKDRDGAAMDSAWVPVDMAAVPALVSEDLGGGAKKQQDALGSFANPDKIATPDNLKFSEKLRTLFIGEDSNTHVNNFLWAYNVDTKTLSRLLSCPAGAESTGLHAVDEIHGWTYIMSNFQHPGDWEAPLHDKVQATLDPLVRASYKDRFGAAVGYLTADMSAIRLSRAEPARTWRRIRPRRPVACGFFTSGADAGPLRHSKGPRSTALDAPPLGGAFPDARA